jgi:hypothetical protein
LANLSKFGVLISGLFTPPIERGAWSSAMMNNTLGFLAEASKGNKTRSVGSNVFIGIVKVAGYF